MKIWLGLLIVLGMVLGGVFLIKNVDISESDSLEMLDGRILDVRGATQVNATHPRYGYHPSIDLFISNDGLAYKNLSNGGMQVLGKDGRPSLTYGFAFSGNAEERNFIRSERDFNWIWTKKQEVVMFEEEGDDGNITFFYIKHIYEADNNDEQLRIIQTYEFDPIHDVKITHNVTNNFRRTTETRFWYLLKDSEEVIFNGQRHRIKDSNINLSGDFNDIMPTVDFGDGTFRYKDVLRDGFDLKQVRIGSGELVGLSDKNLFALGFTKNGGVFPLGQEIIIDPASTGFRFCATVGDPATPNNWTAQDEVCSSDNTYANSTTVGDFMFVDTFPFIIDDDNNITGVEVRTEATSIEAICSGPPPTAALLGMSLTYDNGTSLSESKIALYRCRTVGVDLVRTVGNSTDDWNVFAQGRNVTNTTFRVRVNFTASTGTDFNPGFDSILVNMHHTIPEFDITLQDPSPATDSIVSSTFTVNITSDADLTSSIFTSNHSGNWTNYSMSEEGGNSSRWVITLNGRFRGANNGTIFNYFVFGFIGSTSDFQSILRVNVTSDRPFLFPRTPENFTINTNATVVINSTVSDNEEDFTDIQMTMIYKGINDSRNYITFNNTISSANLPVETELVNGTDVLFNLTIPPHDINDDDIMAMWRFDDVSLFGEERFNAAGGLAVDLVAGRFNGSITGGANVPTLCSLNSITPIFNDCYEFDGISDAVMIEDGSEAGIADIFVNASVSWGAWLYTRSGSTDYAFAKTSAGALSTRFFELSQTGSSARVRIGDGNGATCFVNGFGFAENEWHHATGTWNGSRLTIYRDGFEVGFNENCNLIINRTVWVDSSQPTFIGGAGLNGATSEWDGEIDEIFLYNKTLNSSEVKAIFNLSRSVYTWNTEIWDSPNGSRNYTTTINTTTIVTDTCTYGGSGIFAVLCSDLCRITDNVDLGGNNLTITGIGNFTLDGANISGIMHRLFECSITKFNGANFFWKAS